MSTKRADWGDPEVLRNYFAHGRLKGQHLGAPEDYARLTMRELTEEVVLCPPDSPDVKIGAILAWHTAHSGFLANFETLSLLMSFAFDQDVHLGQPRLTWIESVELTDEMVRLCLSRLSVYCERDEKTLLNLDPVQFEDFPFLRWQKELEDAVILGAPSGPNSKYGHGHVVSLKDLLSRLTNNHSRESFEDVWETYMGDKPRVGSFVRESATRFTSVELQEVLGSARYQIRGIGNGRPCGSLEALFAMGVRKFIRSVIMDFRGRKIMGAAILAEEQTDVAFVQMLRLAYGDELVIPLFRIRQAASPTLIANGRHWLRHYLSHGMGPNGETLSEPIDYLRVRFRDLLHERYEMKGPFGHVLTTCSLISAAGGQRKENLVRLLVQAFGHTSVSAAAKGLQSYEGIVAEFAEAA